MTLIFSHRSPVTGLFVASDVLVSRPTHSDLPFVSIPFKKEPIGPTDKDYSPAGLMQKSIIFGRTLAMWAGSAIVAHAIIVEIYRISEGGKRQIDLASTINNMNLLDKEKGDVSLIYHFRTSESTIIIESHQCRVLRENGAADLIGAGSGCSFFFENLEYEPQSNLAPQEVVLANFLTKISTHSIIEATSDDSLSHLYGAWFEIAHASADSFKKIPYAIRFWNRQKGILGSGGPIFFNWYCGPHLSIMRFDPFESADGIKFRKEHFIVPDPLRRNEGQFPPPHPIRPTFIGHVIFDLDMQCSLMFVETDPHSEEMIVEVSPNGTRIAWTQELRTRLLALDGAGSMMRENWNPRL